MFKSFAFGLFLGIGIGLIGGFFYLANKPSAPMRVEVYSASVELAPTWKPFNKTPIFSQYDYEL